MSKCCVYIPNHYSMLHFFWFQTLPKFLPCQKGNLHIGCGICIYNVYVMSWIHCAYSLYINLFTREIVWKGLRAVPSIVHKFCYNEKLYLQLSVTLLALAIVPLKALSLMKLPNLNPASATLDMSMLMVSIGTDATGQAEPDNHFFDVMLWSITACPIPRLRRDMVVGLSWMRLVCVEVGRLVKPREVWVEKGK